MMVIFVHAAQFAFAATYSKDALLIQIAGQAGVDIFFVLPGVIIATTAHGLTSRDFAAKRLRRIVPMYLLITVPYTPILLATGFGWREAVATLLLWPATDHMTCSWCR
jgi:exopolysaccharide production protein ExoZ